MEQRSISLPDISAAHNTDNADTIRMADMLHQVAERPDLMAAVLKEDGHLLDMVSIATCGALGVPVKWTKLKSTDRLAYTTRALDEAWCNAGDTFKQRRKDEARDFRGPDDRPKFEESVFRDSIEHECFLEEVEREARKMRWELFKDALKQGRSVSELFRVAKGSDLPDSERELYQKAVKTVYKRGPTSARSKIACRRRTFTPASTPGLTLKPDSPDRSWRQREPETLIAVADAMRNRWRRPDAEKKRRRARLSVKIEAALKEARSRVPA